jgi:hypothetical protein
VSCFKKSFTKKILADSVLPGAPLGQFAGNTPAAHPPHLLLVAKVQTGNIFHEGVAEERLTKLSVFT